MFALSFLSLALAQDLRQVPGPWQNAQITLPGRGDKGQDLSVHMLHAGPKDAPTVVLLHGFPDFSYGWRYVLPLLALEYRVIAPDLRGYAGTDHTRGGYELATLSEDLIALLDALPEGDEPVHLIAHDWGASVGWRAVDEHPERFLSWTALDVPHLRTLFEAMESSKAQRRYKRFLFQLVQPFTPALLGSLGPERRANLFYREELVNDAALREEDIPWYQAVFDSRKDMLGPLRYYREIVFHGGEVRAFYAEPRPITVPTLMLWGADDRYMLPPMAQQSCAQVSARCEAEVFSESGHYLHWEQPEQVVLRWRTFVNTLNPQPEAAVPEQPAPLDAPVSSQ